MCAILVQHEAIKIGIHDDRTWQNVYDQPTLSFQFEREEAANEIQPAFIWSRNTIRDFSRY
ncbi:hypothetical protein PG996_013625 [Apiospora saccharicola]|uniref:Uncharacterized protein n=1 Tax=Apiospora saccharicola TaxID=335842 RepID=A0ABR1U601_9PEZI